MAADIRWQREHLDWRPLEALLGEEGADGWMWMHACDSPETHQTVHFYKHVSSRRYLRLDAQGRVYAEKRDGEPFPLPACGGATLLLLLIAACGHVEPGLPATITLSEAAREPATVDDVALLDTLALRVSEEFRSLLAAVADTPAAATAHGRSGDQAPPGGV